jgi:hypothetical protein
LNTFGDEMGDALLWVAGAVCISISLLMQSLQLRRHERAVQSDRNLFTLFANEVLATLRAERTARLAEAELHRRAITQSCHYSRPADPADGGQP